MRIANMMALGGLLMACDGADVAQEITTQARPVPSARSAVTVDWRHVRDVETVAFSAPTTLADAECFASAERPEGTYVAVAKADGSIDLMRLYATRAAAAAPQTLIVVDRVAAPSGRRVIACALSFDAKGQPAVVASHVGAAPGTTHYRREGGAWTATIALPFAATQIAFNARSPRGPELIAVDATTTSVHAVFVDGAWQRLALPATALATPGAKAVAVVADAEGRSHFALGADYYGDRGGQYALWPSRRQSDGAVAIVLDGDTPQILHVEGRDLYRTVIGPDSAATSLWAAGTEITGFSASIATEPGQLSARIDADGYLHTVAAVVETRRQGSTRHIEYVQDRDNRRVSVANTSPSGAIVWSSEGHVLAADHGRLVALERTSTFASMEPAVVLEAPSVGQVDRCTSGIVAGESTVLRRMTGLSAVSLASAADGIHALEWDFDRRAVRQTLGDDAGWTTDAVTAWQLDSMGAGRSSAIVDAADNDHLVWPEGNSIAHWTRGEGGWERFELALERVVGTPDLALIHGSLWLAARTGNDLVVSAFDADARTGDHVVVGEWRAPLALDAQNVTSFDLVDGAATATLVFVEEGHIVSATLGPDGFERSAVAPELAVTGVRGIQLGKQLVVLAVTDGFVVALQDGHEIGRWASATPTRVLAATATNNGAMLMWDDANALHGVAIDIASPDRALERRTLSVSAGATLWNGSVTPDGRLIAVEQNQAAPDLRGVDLIAERCAR